MINSIHIHYDLDNDTAGKDALKRLAQTLGVMGIKVINKATTVGKDENDKLMNMLVNQKNNNQSHMDNSQ